MQVLGAVAVAVAVVAAGCGGGKDPAPAGPLVTVRGHVTAGPTCPIVSDSDPNCQDRPVAGAEIVVRDPDGREVATATAGPDGAYEVNVPANAGYTFEPQNVDGLMGTAPPRAVVVGATSPPDVDFLYDTGIRN